MHVAIAGNIGSGKTTLTTKLSKHYKWEAHYEDVENNPYLNDFYNSQGAKFFPFSGYSLPINFSKGIIKEHLHTRSAAGIFDISHMGSMLIPCTDTNTNKLELICS